MTAKTIAEIVELRLIVVAMVDAIIGVMMINVMLMSTDEIVELMMINVMLMSTDEIIALSMIIAVPPMHAIDVAAHHTRHLAAVVITVMSEETIDDDLALALDLDHVIEVKVVVINMIVDLRASSGQRAQSCASLPGARRTLVLGMNIAMPMVVMNVMYNDNSVMKSRNRVKYVK
jgi:hypothetical protein